MEVMAVFIHGVWVSVPGAEVREIVLSAFTVIVPPEVALPQAPTRDTVYGVEA
jgi:hypothetical protein